MLYAAVLAVMSTMMSAMMYSMPFAAVTLTAFDLLSSPAYAQSYSWQDSKGRTFYGSKPPANARNVKTLKTPRISRYSSTKVLNRLGWKQNQAAPGESKPPPPKQKNELPIDAAPAQLAHDEPVISFDAEKNVTDCKVMVENKGGMVAYELSVAFEFFDGSLIPAVGPGSIEPGGKQEYRIPKDLLPLHLTGDPESVEGEVVRVILHGASQRLSPERGLSPEKSEAADDKPAQTP